MFDSYFKYEDNQVILTKPFIETDNIYSLCTTTQDYLVKIRETRSEELVIPYSGGIDSTFLALCYQDCIKQGRLSRDDYEIISFDFLPQDHPDKIKYWFAETYLSSLNINIHKSIRNLKYKSKNASQILDYTERPSVRIKSHHILEDLKFTWQRTYNQKISLSKVPENTI